MLKFLNVLCIKMYLYYKTFALQNKSQDVYIFTLQTYWTTK